MRLALAFSCSAFLVVPSLGAQQLFTPGGDMGNGQIGVEVIVTLDDGNGTYDPVVGHALTLYRGATDSLQLRTDEAGILKFAVVPGTYRLSSASPIVYHGRNYRWNLPLVVERRMGIVNLTAQNATITAPRGAPRRSTTPQVSPNSGDTTGGTRYYPKGDRPWESSQAPAFGTKGLLIGLKLDGSAIRADDGSTTPSGPGFSFQIGYGPTNQVSLLADITGARVQESGEASVLAHVDLLARYAFTSATRRFAPYLEAGVSGLGMAESDVDLGSGSFGDVTTAGAGVTLGGGGQVFFSPKAAFDFELKWTRGQFTTLKVGDVTYDDISSWVTSARVNIGITLYPTATRKQQ